MLGGIRTPDPRLRRPLLYPAELQTHACLFSLFISPEKRVMGIEPTYPAWKAGVLPLNYTRIYFCPFETIGVTGFEPATSWSQTRRSSQAEPHPVVFFLACQASSPGDAIKYTIPFLKSQLFFYIFFIFLFSGLFSISITRLNFP